MAQVTNTLNRWHKVVERIKDASTKLQGEIQGSELLQITAATRELRLATVADREAKLLANLALLDQLRLAVVDIRNAIQDANLNGITQRMNEMQYLTLKRQTLERLVARLRTTESTEEALAELAAAQVQAATSSYSNTNRSVAVAVVSAENLAVLEKELATVGKRINVLSDEISDLNASRVTLEIQDSVREYVGV